MILTRRAASSFDASETSDDGGSPAMRAVRRAWRHQYSDLREARTSAASAISLAEAAHEPEALAHALFQAAYAAIRAGLAHEATLLSEQCRVRFEALGDARGLWLARALESLCMRFHGEADRAIRTLQELAIHPPSDASATDLFIVHVALSMGYRYVGLLEPALKWHYQAVDTARDTGDSLLLASTLCNLGGYHTDLHNPEEGCRLLEEGLTLASSCDADRTTIIVALNLAQTYGLLGRHDEALAIAERYLTAERYIAALGVEEPEVPLTLALSYANAGRAADAARVFDGVRDTLAHVRRDIGTPHVFFAYVEARIALVSDEPVRAADVSLATIEQLDESAVDSPSYLMRLHATAATACELIGDHARALFHERSRSAIRERLARLAAHVASLTHTIRHELDVARAERDHAMALHAELEREHERLAALNAALQAQIAENQRLHDELKEQNRRDALTGLYNRRYLYEHGPRLVETTLARGAPLCLVMLDLDHFKRLNDEHGHVVGDRVLAALGHLLRGRLRDDDVACRVGGEEFALLLPATGVAVAEERLLGLLDDLRTIEAVDDGAPLPARLTFSAGIAQAHDGARTVDALMIAADRLLYKAKRDGRARVEIDRAAVAAGAPASESAVARQPLDH